MLLNALSDTSSAYYKGIVAMLRTCEANERRAKLVQTSVVLPVPLEELDVVALEQQFAVAIKVKVGTARVRMSPRVAGVSFLVESALLEHAGGCGRTVMMVDGDVMTMAAVGVTGRLVERSNATPRLATGYFLENECLRRFATNRSSEVSIAADLLNREMTAGGGEHYWPVVREDGPSVDSIVVNHFKTPVGPKQLAWLAYKRGAVVYGVLPFQVDMLTQDTGRLEAFPGFYYVDREHDVVTFVPEVDATMSFSHPYSALVQIVSNNVIVVDGREFLCEKYCSVKGIFYYTLKSVDIPFEAPETLRTSYFDASVLGVTEISYPAVLHSSEGVPVGWRRDKVRMLTSRFEKVMSRVMTSANEVVGPVEVFTALMDYNNSVVSTLDTVTIADRMSVADEEKAALAIALHVNWTRHAARGTFNTLVSAIKLRHSVKDTSLFGLAFVALSAWWSRPDVSGLVHDGELPAAEVVDWCGNDFSVVMSDVDPWIEVVQVAGLGVETGGCFYDWMPRPVASGSWYASLIGKVRAAVGGVDDVEKPAKVGKVIVRGGPPLRMRVSEAVVVKPVLTVVDEASLRVERVMHELTDLKESLKRKMALDQGARDEVVPDRFLAVRQPLQADSLCTVPVVQVEPVAAINDDLMMCNGGPFDRDMVATGYRLAELDVDKVTEGSFVVNDAKRLVPASRWVRRPRVDAGVEGKRVASQAALMGALFKRNIGVPSNRGSVDLDSMPHMVVEKVIRVCYRDGWQEIVERHLNTGMWEPNVDDIGDFLTVLDEKKVKGLLDEFFQEGQVDLTRWMLLAKGKIKASREVAADAKVDHSQTILYLESSSTNAMYSAMTRRFKECLDECLRPEVSLNAQRSDEEHEVWYNSLDSLRQSFGRTYSYAADVKCYDRSQEHVALRIDLEFYRRHGLGPERLKIWEETHGVKKARAMMFGVVLSMVLGGVSGLWKTLLRNGLVNLAAIVVSTGISRKDVVMLDIKGDDSDSEFSRPIEVETTVERMSLSFNFSAKFFTNDVRYMCKAFRIRMNGRWYFVADPWARVQSLCTPLWVGNVEDNLNERWVSLCADLRHYDNGLLVDAVAEAAMQYYGLSRPLYGLARGLAMVRADRSVYFNFFHPPEMVS